MRLVGVYLYGPLASKYGAEHAFAVRTPTEAVRALEANYPGFIADFAKTQVYGIFADGDWREGEKAPLLPVSREIHFAPKIEGQGFLIAPVLTAFFPALGTTAASIIGGLLFAGLMVGISFLLAPKTDKQAEDKKDESFAFSGPENVTQQGVAVPLIYGRCHAGSVVVSAGLEAIEQAISGPAPPAPPPPAPPPPPPIDPPPGGWPPIVQDKWGVLYPLGWVMTQVVNVTDHGVVKQVRLYQPLLDHGVSKYAWDEIRGFFMFTGTSTTPDDDQWATYDGWSGHD